MEKIKIKLDGGMMPKKATPYDAAYDVYVPEDFEVGEGRQLIDLGFSMEMPHGMGAFIRARSGFLKNGIEAVEETNDGKKYSVHIDSFTPTGLIDCGYRGHLGVICVTWNISRLWNSKRIYIPKGTRICQLQFVAVPYTDLIEVDELDMTDNRGGGFGHTNK
jgi:dUTP pyrophosphatase